MARIRRSGRDVTLIASGPPVDDCLAAAEACATRGVDVEVLDLGPSAAADDAVILGSVSRTKNAVVIGDGAEISCRIHEELFPDLEHAVQRLAEGSRDDIEAALRRLMA